jgi:hypothetical protein
MRFVNDWNTVAPPAKTIVKPRQPDSEYSTSQYVTTPGKNGRWRTMRLTKHVIRSRVREANKTLQSLGLAAMFYLAFHAYILQKLSSLFVFLTNQQNILEFKG